MTQPQTSVHAQTSVQTQKTQTSTQRARTLAWLTNMGERLKPKSEPVYHSLEHSPDQVVSLTSFYQRANVGQFLLGRQLGVAQSLLAKVVPQTVFEHANQQLFDKLARLAKAWALRDLKKDERFLNLASLSKADKDALIADIISQNRALTVIGGATGFLGLVGVVVDTAWLLLVSLRGVYQLALVCRSPLADKSDVAYSLLSQLDLDKLGQKQVLLVALALADKVLINAQNLGLKTALSTMLASYPLTGGYQKQFDELFGLVNIDKLNVLNSRWLHHLLPLTAVMVGGYYNRELIDGLMNRTLATCQQHQQIEQKVSNHTDEH